MKIIVKITYSFCSRGRLNNIRFRSGGGSGGAADCDDDEGSVFPLSSLRDCPESLDHSAGNLVVRCRPPFCPSPTIYIVYHPYTRTVFRAITLV